MQFGSLINLVTSGPSATKPEVGLGATVLMWSDRHAATIVEVPNERTVIIQADTATRTDTNGMSDAQSYEYSRNEDAPRVTYTLRKNGRWIKKGQSIKDGTTLMIGYRDEHYDYSF